MNGSRKFLFHKFLIVTLCGICLAFCSQTAQQSESDSRSAFALESALLGYLDTGNCARSLRVGTNSGKLFCSRAPRQLCTQRDGYYTSPPLIQYGKLWMIKETSDRYRAEWGFYRTDYSECTTSFASAASSVTDPGFQVLTSTALTTQLTNNTYTMTDDCSNLGNANIAKLATKEQFKFLVSPLGVLSWQAKATGQTACLDKLLPSGTNRQTVLDLVAGTLLLETSCGYGSASAPHDCSSAEKTLANPFDFTNAL